jgi:hypothetical protein
VELVFGFSFRTVDAEIESLTTHLYLPPCFPSMIQCLIPEDHTMVLLVSNALTVEHFFGMLKMWARIGTVLPAQSSITNAAREERWLYRASIQDLNP